MKSEFKFEELKVYEKALDFIDEVYSLTKSFPKDELYGLTSQLKRASTSIALNIGEGHGASNAQFNRYLQMAWDSAKECIVCLRIAKRQDFISKAQENNQRAKISEICKMIIGLKKYLNNKT